MTLRVRAAAILAAAAATALAATSARAETADDRAEHGDVAPAAIAAASWPEAPTLAGSIVVDVRDDASEADIADLAARHHLSLRPSSRWSRTHDKLEVGEVDPRDEPAVLEALARDPRVESAEPMGVYGALFVPDDPLYASKQWHLQHVGAERAWDYACGHGVTVAVVDTGVACFDKGPFSRGSDLVGTRCAGGWNFVDDSSEASDDQGHGTHVAGTIAQTTNNGVGAAGLAYCATLMPIKVLNKQGFGTVANVAEGIRFAADEGAQIINLSLGGPIKSRILEQAVAHAVSRGVVVVAAAGNSGGAVGWPAAYPGVIAVSATDESDAIARFSSRGPEVVLAAPGVNVTQQTICNGGREKCEIFGTFNGTSMASPHVAGIAALVESLGVTRGDAVRDALTSTATAKEGRELYGAGIINAGAATARVFWRHALGRFAALGAIFWFVARILRERGRQVNAGVAPLVGALVAATGLCPWASAFGLRAGSGALGGVVELAMRPFGEWDLALVGASAHRWMLLASALPVLGLTAVGFANARLRPAIGGFALGMTAFLAAAMWWGDVAFVGGDALARLWCLANGLVCLWVARVGLEGPRRGPA